MSITKCLSAHTTFTTCTLQANSSKIFYANPISGFPVTGKSSSTVRIATTTVRWNSMIVYAGADDKHGGAPPPPPPAPPSSTWKNWVIGFLMTFIFPFFTTKGGPIKAYMQKLDNMIDTAEHISDVVEAVADKVDKVTEKLSDDMPEGSKLKSTLEFIEQVAERVEKDAQTAGDFIDKVQEMQDKIEDLLEPMLDEAKDVEKEVNDHELISKHNHK